MAGRWFHAAFCTALVAGFAGAAAHAETAPVAASEFQAIATDIRLAGDDKTARLIVDLSRKLDPRVFTLANPYRVVVDLPQTLFQLPSQSDGNGRGLVKAYRHGLVMAGGSRIVIDVAKPVLVESAFVLEPQDGQPARLVLDLAATDRDSFARAQAAQTQAAQTQAAQAAQTQVAQTGPTASLASRLEAASLADNSDSRPLIVIDPGHGGPDTGAKTADGAIMEKDMVLDFSLTLRDRLQKSGRYRIMLTRSDDTFIPLAERVKMARARDAALFISVHADSLPKADSEVQGATVYTLSEKASDTEAAQLAETENRADIVAGVDLSREPDEVAGILFDLAQRETRGDSQQFARALVGEMKTAMRLHKKPLKSASFVVLKAPDVPSVLVELGYMTNRQDMKLMTSKDWHGKAAQSMVEAVDAFFRTRMAGANPSPARP